MKKLSFLGLIAAIMWGGETLAQVTLPRAASPAAEVSQTIGISKITINYSRPGVKEREIWGKLVPYGYNNLGFGTATAAPWRAGANENTTITFSDDATVEGQSIPAGTYGLFVGVNEDGSADVIFSNNSTSWGSFFYSEDEDQLRVKVQSEEIPSTERLTYDFVDIDNTSATVVLNWEKKRFPFKVSFDVHEIVLASARNELRSTQGFSWIGPASAAQYCLQNNIHLEEGLKWANQAMSNTKNFNTVFLTAALTEQNGKKDEAMPLYDQAADEANLGQLNFLGYQMLNKGNTDKALAYFKLNVERNPDNANCHDSLGECYKNIGDNKSAIKELKKALSLDPPANTKANSIKLLKELGVDTSPYETGE